MAQDMQIDGLVIHHQYEGGILWRGRQIIALPVRQDERLLAHQLGDADFWAHESEALAKNSWTPALLTGKEFDAFVDKDFSTLRATMVRAGMV